MIKITKDNVTRLSEDSLYIALDELHESDGLYVLIEAELDRRIEMQERLLARRHEAQLESLKLTQAIQAELQVIFEGFKGTQYLSMLIENFGQEFIEDYTIDEETLTVFSKVTHGVFTNPTSWECDTIEKARRKMSRLIYYRIYNKFMRDATPDNLELLKTVLGKFGQ
jgi:hypothetical protein